MYWLHACGLSTAISSRPYVYIPYTYSMWCFRPGLSHFCVASEYIIFNINFLVYAHAHGEVWNWGYVHECLCTVAVVKNEFNNVTVRIITIHSWMATHCYTKPHSYPRHAVTAGMSKRNQSWADSCHYVLSPAVPTMPLSLMVDDYDHNYITLSWSPPETPNGIVDLYRVTYQGFKDESLIDKVLICLHLLLLLTMCSYCLSHVSTFDFACMC